MRVICAAYDYEKKEWAEIDVSVNLRVYPCCAYQGYYEFNKWDDKRFKDLPLDWNDLRVNDLETIKKTMFTILNVENFNSGKAPRKCKEICGVNVEERHMSMRGK